MSWALAALLFYALASPNSGQVTQRMKALLIEQHNKCRAADGQSRVRWNSRLAAFAQRQAERCVLSHSTNDARTQRWGRSTPVLAGENLAMQWHTSSSFLSSPSVGDKATLWSTDEWCGEKKWYDINSNSCRAPPNSPGCGHYTQMVWHDSNQIGCGFAKCRHKNPDEWHLACLYLEAGNTFGERPYNPSSRTRRPATRTRRPASRPSTRTRRPATRKPSTRSRTRKPRTRKTRTKKPRRKRSRRRYTGPRLGTCRPYTQTTGRKPNYTVVTVRCYRRSSMICREVKTVKMTTRSKHTRTHTKCQG